MAKEKIIGVSIKAADKSSAAFDSVKKSANGLGMSLVDVQKKGNAAAKEIGTNLKGAIDSSTKALQPMNAGLRSTQKLSAQAASQARGLGNELRTAGNSASFEKLKSSLVTSISRIRGLRSELRELKKELNSIKAENLKLSVQPVAKPMRPKSGGPGLGDMVMFGSAAIGAISMARGITDTVIAAERLDRVLVTITGSQQAAAKEMKYLKDLSKDLGLEFRGLASDYGGVIAAAKGTKLEGDSIRKVYTSVASASAALGLSADDTSGVLRALNQMISKGKVQAEELRGQLGERLPGAFQIAARAMGLSTAELDKFLQMGLITAEEMLPAFARQLDKEFGESGKKNADSLQGSINQVKNAWEELKITLADKVVVDAVRDVLSGLKVVANEAKMAIEALKGYSQMMGEVFSSGGSKPDELAEKIRQFRFQVPEDYDSLIAEKERSLRSGSGDNSKIKEEIAGLSREKRNLVFTMDLQKELNLTKEINLETRQLARVRKSFEAGYFTNSEASQRIDTIREKLRGLTGALKEVQKNLGKASTELKSPNEADFELPQKKELKVPAEDKSATSTDTAKTPDPKQVSDKDAQAIGEGLRKKAGEATAKAEESKLKKQAESIRNQFRTEVERVREEMNILDELYAKRDSLGNSYLSKEDFDRARKWLEEKEALALVDKETVRLREEVDGINRSFMTQSERLGEVKKRLQELYDAGLVAAPQFEETIKRINKEIEDSAKKIKSEYAITADEIKSSFANAFSSAATSGQDFAKSLKNSLASLFIDKAANMLTAGLFGDASATSKKGKSGLLGGLFGGFFADGGLPDPSKPYIAGENGRELIMPAGQSHRVFNAQDTKRIFQSANSSQGAAGVTVVQNLNFAEGVNAVARQEIYSAMPEIVRKCIEAMIEHDSRRGRK